MWFSGRPKDDKQLGSESQHFLKMFSQTSEERYQFLLGRRWVYQILVLSGDDVVVLGKKGSTWFNLVVPFEPEEAGFTRWSSHWRNWQRFAVDELAAGYCCGYQVGSKHFDRGILHRWQHFKWKCARSFGHYPPKNVSVFRVCLRTSWTNNTVRWISGGEDVLFLAFLRLNEAETIPKHLVAKHQQCFFLQVGQAVKWHNLTLHQFFSSWRSFCPQPAWQDIVEVSSRIVLGFGEANDQSNQST